MNDSRLARGGHCSSSVREVSRRLVWLCDKIDATRGPQSAIAREARALAWVLDEVVGSNRDVLSPGAATEYAEARARYDALLLAWSNRVERPSALPPDGRGR